MSRSSVAARAPQPERRLRRSPGPAVARRVSGPVADQRSLAPARPRLLPSPRPVTGLAGGARAVAGGGVAIASRAASLALDVSASRAMDRLVRSRGWIVIVGFGLIGIVAMQVSLLKLNAGIGRAVETATTLERSNSALRLDVSELSSTNRILRLATDKGFAMPAPVDVHYLRAGDLASDGRRAVRNMRAPDPNAGALTPSAAPPAGPQADSAVVSSAISGATRTATGTSGAAQGSPATPTAGAAPPAAGGTTSSGTATPAPTSGGVSPSTPSATTRGP